MDNTISFQKVLNAKMVNKVIVYTAAAMIFAASPARPVSAAEAGSWTESALAPVSTQELAAGNPDENTQQTPQTGESDNETGSGTQTEDDSSEEESTAIISSLVGTPVFIILAVAIAGVLALIGYSVYSLFRKDDDTPDEYSEDEYYEDDQYYDDEYYEDGQYYDDNYYEDGQYYGDEYYEDELYYDDNYYEDGQYYDNGYYEDSGEYYEENEEYPDDEYYEENEEYYEDEYYEENQQYSDEEYYEDNEQYPGEEYYKDNNRRR